MTRTVIGVFRSRDQAERAVSEMRDNGFGENEISIVAREDRARGTGGRGGGEGVGDRLTNATGIGSRDDISEGVGWGGTLGGLAGLLAGAGALAIPGIGPIVAAGPIAGALSGAVSGGIAGGLLDWGIPEERGRQYERDVREGRILALIRSEERRVDRAAEILRRNGATDVEIHEARY